MDHSLDHLLLLVVLWLKIVDFLWLSGERQDEEIEDRDEWAPLVV